MNQKRIHLFRFALIGLLGSVLLAPYASHAQGSQGTQDLPRRDQNYFRSLARLSQIIGGAHAVRVRCNGVDDQYWRSYMVQILSLEAPNQGNLRTRMVAGFNQGFENEDSSGRFCDDSSNEVEARYAADGRRISEELAAFYFPRAAQ